MLSQYSWGDLFKVVLVALIIYYAYVLIKYYREDIREWISNRGNKPDSQSSIDEPEVTDHSSLYAVNQYTPVNSGQPAPAAAPAASGSETSSLGRAYQVPEPDLKGVILDQDEPTEFSFPIQAEAVRPAEQSVSELISAAQRVQANDEGALIPNDPNDKAAATLAEVINRQQNRSALAGISFKR